MTTTPPPAPTEPSAEALDRDRPTVGPSKFSLAWLREHIGFNEEIESEAYGLVETAYELDSLLDRFRAAGVREEREECAKVADADAADGRLDLDNPELKGLAGAGILAAKRIADAIRRRGPP